MIDLPAASRFLRVWRSPRLPMALAWILILAGVPIFLRLPLWCDVSLYDVAAHAILSGGVHYRDVFDTNTPGYVWCLTLLRATLGDSSLAVRGVDLGIFAGVAFLLDRLAKLGGGTPTTRWWALAGMVAFYPFGSESLHAQRDVWLALPMLTAVFLRVRRIVRSAAGASARYFWPAFAEGLLWALATWIKPHVVPLAFAVWLLTVRRLGGGSWRIAGRDLAGNLAAGIALGLAGIGLLVASGTWPHFWIVMTEWNRHYADLVYGELGFRFRHELGWFPPWSLLLVPSLLLALLTLIDGRVFSARWLPAGERGPMGREISPRWFDPAPDDPARFARAVLAWVYVVWAFESLVFQRAFEYVHVVETLMMMALWASHRWCLPAFALGWIASLNLMLRLGDDFPGIGDAFRNGPISLAKLDLQYRHPLAEPGFGERWLDAFRTSTTGPDDARLKDRLKKCHHHVATTSWEELGEVEAFLRERGVKDRELICWDEGTHPLYLQLRIRPGLRFMHVHTAENIGPDADATVRGERLANRAARFLVADLEWVEDADHPYADYSRNESASRYRPGRAPGDAVPALTPLWDGVFPYDGPKAIFRSGGGTGRYLVFALGE